MLSAKCAISMAFQNHPHALVDRCLTDPPTPCLVQHRFGHRLSTTPRQSQQLNLVDQRPRGMLRFEPPAPHLLLVTSFPIVFTLQSTILSGLCAKDPVLQGGDAERTAQSAVTPGRVVAQYTDAILQSAHRRTKPQSNSLTTARPASNGGQYPGVLGAIAEQKRLSMN